MTDLSLDQVESQIEACERYLKEEQPRFAPTGHKFCGVSLNPIKS